MHYIIRQSGEMNIKSPYVRKQFQRRLATNIHAAFKPSSYPVSLKEEWGLIHLRTDHPAAEDILARIFGIKSFSRIEGSCPSTIDDIVSTGYGLYHQRVKGKSFAVRGLRTGHHGFSSMDAQSALGSALNKDLDSRVDLSNPELQIHVQIRRETTYFYTTSRPGPGGYPVGSSGRALCLISGGFDSAVAAWLTQKRGVAVDYVFFNLAGSAYEHSVVKVAKYLSDNWSAGHAPRFFIVDFRELADQLRKNTRVRFAQVVLKRYFYRAASHLARRTKAQALITGEAIGQVSSQTLSNLATIEAAAGLPVLRPLIVSDKDDIIALSRSIGTFDLTKSTQEFCQLTTEKPATACTLAQAEEAESCIEGDLLARLLDDTRMLKLAELSPDALLSDYIFTDTVPEAATLVDCRSENEYQQWHPTAAIHRTYHELADHFSDLPRSSTYVIYCGVGVQSAIIAEKMQTAGYMAYSFKGGLEKLRKHLEPECLLT